MAKKKHEITDTINCIDDAGEEVVVFEITTFVGAYNLSDGITHWRKGLTGYRTSEGHALNRIDEKTFEEFVIFGTRLLTRQLGG